MLKNYMPLSVRCLLSFSITAFSLATQLLSVAWLSTAHKSDTYQSTISTHILSSYPESQSSQWHSSITKSTVIALLFFIHYLLHSGHYGRLSSLKSYFLETFRVKTFSTQFFAFLQFCTDFYQKSCLPLVHSSFIFMGKWSILWLTMNWRWLLSVFQTTSLVFKLP